MGGGRGDGLGAGATTIGAGAGAAGMADTGFIGGRKEGTEFVEEPDDDLIGGSRGVVEVFILTSLIMFRASLQA